MTSPRDCPRWDGCSAPVCPLDENWRDHGHGPDERVCGLLCELAKEGGEARLRGALPCTLVDTLTMNGPLVAARWERVRKRLREASRTGSRMAAGQRLTRTRGGAVVDVSIGDTTGAGAAGRTTAPPGGG